MSWVHGKGRRLKTTKVKKKTAHAAHRRHGTSLAAGAKIDAWKHKFQARKQG